MKTQEKFKVGDKVECNGNKEAHILGYYTEHMVNVRLYSGFRHVGDVCVDESACKINRD